MQVNAPLRRGKAPSDTQVARLSVMVSGLVRQFRILDRDQKCCYDVTISQCYAMDTIGEEEPLRMHELAQLLGVVQSTVTRILGPLERRKLVRRERDAEDGRAINLRLTAAGRTLRQKLQVCSQEFFAEVLGSIPEGKRESVLESMDMLAAAVAHGCACPE